jgi:hypothetical protein
MDIATQAATVAGRIKERGQRGRRVPWSTSNSSSSSRRSILATSALASAGAGAGAAAITQTCDAAERIRGGARGEREKEREQPTCLAGGAGRGGRETLEFEEGLRVDDCSGLRSWRSES